MTNEEFQKVVLEELKGIKQDVSDIKQDVSSLKQDVSDLKQDVSRIENKLNDLEAKNADRHLKIEEKLNLLIEDSISIKEVLGEHEIAIRSLRRRPV